MIDVASAEEKRHGAVSRGVEDGLPGTRIRAELPPISPPKLFPALHPVVEPLPELRAGRDLLAPCVECEGLFLHASRPKTLHEDSPAVTARGSFIRPLDSNHRGETTGGSFCEQLGDTKA